MKMPRKPTRISVIGGSRAEESDLEQAEAAGRAIAEREAILICGGLGGVMEAACRGAVEAGGRTVGILPGNQPDMANPYVQIPIVTGMGEGRNVLVAKSGNGVLAIDGRFGTMTEIGFALKSNRPVAALGEWKLADVNPSRDQFLRASSPQDAVEWLFEQVTGS